MGYTDTFIRVARDCPVETGTVPGSNRPLPPVHVIQYELLAGAPYTFTHEELLYEVHVRHKQIAPEDRENRRAEIWNQLFAKKHPCLRTCMLAKRYGWGIHFDRESRIAIYGKESPEYDRLTSGGELGVKLLDAMRSKRN